MSYILITGASSGLGLEFAKQFAKKGENLVLVARRKEKLEQIKLELEQKHSIKVIVFNIDLTNLELVKKLKQDLEQQNISIKTLINNAGFGTSGCFLDTAFQKEIDLLDLNIKALLALSKLFLQDLIDNKGTILNVASIAAFMPLPFMTNYAASKAFVLNFSQALRLELKNKVNVCVLCPGPTKTEFFEVANMKSNPVLQKNLMPADKVVEIAINQMAKNKAVIVPGLINKIMVSIAPFIPSKILEISAKNFV
jgi:short-subunit dehydrogenase